MCDHEKDHSRCEGEPRKVTADNEHRNRGQSKKIRAHQKHGRTFAPSAYVLFFLDQTLRVSIASFFAWDSVRRAMMTMMGFCHVSCLSSCVARKAAPKLFCVRYFPPTADSRSWYYLRSASQFRSDQLGCQSNSKSHLRREAIRPYATSRLFI